MAIRDDGRSEEGRGASPLVAADPVMRLGIRSTELETATRGT